MAEFALILPILLLTVFVIIEAARLLFAWLAVENGARFAIRYAVTGDYDPAHDSVAQCNSFYSQWGITCVAGEDAKIENAARVMTIEDVATGAASGILLDPSLDVSTGWSQPGYFKVTVCDDPANYTDPNPDNFTTDWTAACIPADSAGSPGSRIWVTVDFNHRLIVPFLTDIWPVLHLTARRDGIVEMFRVSRLVGSGGLPTAPGTSTFTPTPSDTPTPSLTPTETLTPSITPTPSTTFTPSLTATASQTSTPSNTPTITFTPSPTYTSTPSLTPSATPLPNCTGVKFSGGIQFLNGARLQQRIVNNTYPGLLVTSITIYWDPLEQASSLYGWNMRVSRIDFRGAPVFVGPDHTSPTSSSFGLPIAISMGGSGNLIRVDWSGAFTGRFNQSPLNLSGSNFGFSVNFSDPACNLSRGAIPASFPPPTVPPPPSPTFTPSLTPTASRTPTPSYTPTSTYTETPRPTLHD
jgi:hypothetical protein